MIDAGMSLGSDMNSIMEQYKTSGGGSASAANLQSRLSKLDNASDAELMEACKSFESYLVEQVMSKVKTAIVPEDEEKDDPYLKMFGDKLYQEYAKTISDSGELGLAQKLYEAMKRDYGSSVKPAEITPGEDAMSAAAESGMKAEQ